MSSTDDEDDAELQRAIALSLDRDTTSSEPAAAAPPAAAQANPQTLTASIQGLAALDRKTMEQERLARRAAASAKKRGSISPPPLREPDERPAKRAKITGKQVYEATRNRRAVPSDTNPFKTISEHDIEEIPPPDSHPNGSAARSKLQYPRGAVKKTWCFRQPRQGDDIKLEEVLQKNDLKLAVLSSFQWDDIDWVLSKLNTKETKIVLVMQAKSEVERDEAQAGVKAIPNMKLCFPNMAGQINCMHSKLMLLSYETHLRVVVPSANLTSYDWGETGVMENIVFLVDLPRLLEEERIGMEEVTPFGQELIHFAKALGLDERVVGSLLHFDFSDTKHLAFVHSIGGGHTASAASRTGLCGLSAAIRQLDLKCEGTLNLDIVTASIGVLDPTFLLHLYHAASGNDALTLDSDKPKLKATKSDESGLHPMSIYFPTQDTVEASVGGPDNAGTICYRYGWWEKLDPSIKHMFRDYRSRRKGILSHSKMLFGRDPSAVSPQRVVAWAYVGSANLSESAWGKLTFDRKIKEPKINCRNWECGVVITVSKESKNNNGVTPGMFERFEKLVPVPMEYPGEEYGNKKPWFFQSTFRAGGKDGAPPI